MWCQAAQAIAAARSSSRWAMRSSGTVSLAAPSRMAAPGMPQTTLVASSCTSVGAPALEALSLTARESVNFYGDVALSTYDAITGKSALQQLVLQQAEALGEEWV